MNDANQTEHQFLALSSALEKETRRVARWFISCFVFAIAVSVLVAATKSFVFLAVALFAWFFAWNRWKLRRLLRSYLPSPNENQDAWVENTVSGLQNPPAWYRYSDYIAAFAFLAAFLLITIEVTSNSGIGMRSLYALCWVLSIATVAVKVRNITHHGDRRAALPHR